LKINDDRDIFNVYHFEDRVASVAVVRTAVLTTKDSGPTASEETLDYAGQDV